jgi:hypothetical protein
MLIFSPLFYAFFALGVYMFALSIPYMIRCKIYFFTTGSIGYMISIVGTDFYYDNDLESGLILLAIGVFILIWSRYIWPSKGSGQYRRWREINAKVSLKDRLLGRLPVIE